MSRPDTESESNGVKPRQSGKLSDLEGRVQAPLNGEDTDKHNLRLLVGGAKPDELASPSSGADAMEQLNQLFKSALMDALNEHGGGDDGSGGEPPRKKRLTPAGRSGVLVALIVALFGSGGIVTTVYLVKDNAARNEAAIKEHHALPMHDDAQGRIAAMEGKVLTIEEKLTDIRTTQATIVQGIEGLKQENKTREESRLKRENEELKREIRRINREQ
jgi:hypothetical protein